MQLGVCSIKTVVEAAKYFIGDVIVSPVKYEVFFSALLRMESLTYRNRQSFCMSINDVRHKEASGS